MKTVKDRTPARRVDGSGRGGFTLIEVSLAVLVMGLGLLTVFGLFPAGLRSAEEGAADTKCGMFAQSVLDGMHGNATTITNWSEWCNGSQFSSEVSAPLGLTVGSAGTITFPAGGEIIRYTLSFNTSNPNQYSALLKVWAGAHGSTSFPSTFYTEFVYSRF